MLQKCSDEEDRIYQQAEALPPAPDKLSTGVFFGHSILATGRLRKRVDIAKPFAVATAGVARSDRFAILYPPVPSSPYSA
jgi:hypothetical protein